MQVLLIKFQQYEVYSVLILFMVFNITYII